MSLATRTSKALRCAACGRFGEAQIHVASLGIYAAEWLRPPMGWWVLLGTADPHVRCPGCLAEPR